MYTLYFIYVIVHFNLLSYIIRRKRSKRTWMVEFKMRLLPPHYTTQHIYGDGRFPCKITARLFRSIYPNLLYSRGIEHKMAIYIVNRRASWNSICVFFTQICVYCIDQSHNMMFSFSARITNEMLLFRPKPRPSNINDGPSRSGSKTYISPNKKRHIHKLVLQKQVRNIM